MADTPQSLENKVALITGATSGIGEMLAVELARRGAHIVYTGLANSTQIDALNTKFASSSGPALFIPADLSAPGDATALVTTTEAKLGRVDILVNNAGVQHVEAVDSFPTDKWDLIMAVNLSAVFHATRAALPGMKSRGFGRIINIASAHGLVASPFKSAYVASKHGVVGFTKAVALEIAAEANLTCNAICPGYVKTPLVDGQIKDQAAAHNMTEDQVVSDIILAAQPNKRFVEAHELAALVALLSGDDGRSFNGAALSIDGGWTAR